MGGHTPGGTTWSWRSCEGPSCVDVVYANTFTPISLGGYRCTGEPATALKESIERVASLPCDVIVAAHPGFTRIFEKLAARASATAATATPLVEPQACRDYATRAMQMLQERLQKEKQP